MQFLPRNSDEFVQREECYSTLSKQELAPSGNLLVPGLSRLHWACPSVFLDKHYIKERGKYRDFHVQMQAITIAGRRQSPHFAICANNCRFGPFMQIKIVNKSGNPLPAYETQGSAGMDVRAFIKADVILRPFERQLIPTGLFIELPDGYEAQLRPRSGLAFKHGISLPNAPATIDSDYRGEIKVALVNLSQQAYTIKNGDRIAQMVIARHEKASWVIAEGLNDTSRGHGGFGSTGT